MYDWNPAVLCIVLLDSAVLQHKAGVYEVVE